MIVTVIINTCRDCRYLGSSGQYTPGGPVPVCDHNKAMDRRLEIAEGDEPVRVLQKGGMSPLAAYSYIRHSDNEERESIINGRHWIHRVPFIDWNKPILPEWCPLAHGAKY